MTHFFRRRSCGRSDVGRRRPHNEDAILADDTLGLYVVADGVGGEAKGEVASAASVAEMRTFICNAHREIESYHNASNSDEERRLGGMRRLMESAVQHAGYMVFGLAEQDPDGLGMATTVSALLVVGDLAVVAQVGDSRVYQRRDGKVVQLTEDHTLLAYKVKKGLLSLEQAKTSKNNAITRAVGRRDHVQVDTSIVRLAAGDRYLLCSDGLHGYLDPGDVETLLAQPTVEETATRGIVLANERGGKDNISAVVVEIWGKEGATRPAPPPRHESDTKTA